MSRYNLLLEKIKITFLKSLKQNRNLGMNAFLQMGILKATHMDNSNNTHMI